LLNESRKAEEYMSVSEIPEEWLEKLNTKMGADGIPHIRRPFEAISTWTRDNNCSICLDSPTAEFVFQWFKVHSPDGSHAIGSLFTGVYFFDAYFWKVSVPIAYGTVQLNALDQIVELPEFLRNRLMADRERLVDYLTLWTNALDYGFGVDDLRGCRKLVGFAAELAAGADQELRATVRLLTESRHANSKAMESAGLATEMFLKAYLARHVGLTELEAKQLSHNLAKTADKCKRVKGLIEFERIAQLINVFPAWGARYKGNDYDNMRLWVAYSVAQFAAATFTRSLTDRDSRAQAFGSR